MDTKLISFLVKNDPTLILEIHRLLTINPMDIKTAIRNANKNVLSSCLINEASLQRLLPVQSCHFKTYNQNQARAG